MSDIMPCPFCGSPPALDIHYNVDAPAPLDDIRDVDFVVIRCSSCGISKQKRYRSDAVEWWNKRRPATPSRPVSGEPVAFVPLHPRNGPLWSDTYSAKSDVHRSENYERMPLYATPPAAAEREEWKFPCDVVVRSDSFPFETITILKGCDLNTIADAIRRALIDPGTNDPAVSPQDCRAAVIEECAKVAETKFAGTLTDMIGRSIAAAIRSLAPKGAA